MPQQYEHYNDATVPLFGEDSRKAQVADLALGGVTVVTVVITLALAFTHVDEGSGERVDRTKIFFGVSIIFLALPQIVLVKWFRDGDLHPKFRYLIGYMMCSIVLLCVCCTVYFYKRTQICP